MELEKLIKQRESYGGQIIHLAIKIAILFLVPAILAIIISRYADIAYINVFPFAFIISWTGVILLYRKVSKEVRTLNERIKELRALETNIDEVSLDTPSASK